jgi:hypothetical protein
MSAATVMQVTLAGPGVCKRCGCTDAWACAGGCYWIDAEHTLCSACLSEDEMRSRIQELMQGDDVQATIKDELQKCGALDDDDDEPDDDERCQECGCSESKRCDAGCQWVNEHKNLCSSCAVPKPEGCICRGDWFGEDGDCELHPSCVECGALFGAIDNDTGLLKPGKCECGIERPATSPAAEART